MNLKLNKNLSDDFIDRLQEEKQSLKITRSDALPDAVVDQILFELNERFCFTTPQSIAAIAIIFQQGGTARSCDGNTSVEIFNTHVKLVDIRRILKNNRCSREERKLARALANQIQEVSLALKIPGNLYNKIRREYPHRQFNYVEQSWLSDFQANNDSCPPPLRVLINETFKKRD